MTRSHTSGGLLVHGATSGAEPPKPPEHPSRCFYPSPLAHDKQLAVPHARLVNLIYRTLDTTVLVRIAHSASNPGTAPKW